MPYFLLSHVRGDDDAYVQILFEDLCYEVGRLTGRRRDDIGVLAVDLEPGADKWPPATAAALAECQVFLPLCTPRALLSESTGRQWWIFQERLRRFRDEVGRDAPSMLPVRWSAVDDLPPGFGEFAVLDPEQPRRPLRQYLRLRSLRARYHVLLRGLAQRIVDTATTYRLREYWPLPPPSQVPDAFASPRPGGRPLARGVRNVRFVVAAGSQDDMERVRAAVQYYGRDSSEWAPYRPLNPQPLAEQARAVAAEQLFGSEVSDVKDLRRTLDLAKESNDLVVLLLDPWSTRIPGSRRHLADADREGLPDAAVLVPVNSADPESERSHEELMFDVRRTLAQFLGRSDALYLEQLPTAESFGSQLATTLEQGRNRTYRRPPAGPTISERPILHGP